MKIRNARAAAIGFCISLIAVAMTPPAAVAQDVSFKDMRVVVLVGSEAGGGTDTSARIAGPYFTKYLSGHPTFVVQNMPGAGGITSQNHFVARVKPDGTTVTMGASNQVDPLQYRKSAASYDPTKYAYVGGVGRGANFLLVNKETEPRLYDKTKEPLVMGIDSPERAYRQMPLWGIEYLGWNARWVTSYRGTNEVFLALERGEVDMTATSNFFQVERALKTGKFKVLAQLGSMENGKMVPRLELKDTPIFSDMISGKITDKVGQQGYDYWLSMWKLDKWMALPPGTPSNIVQAYRDAFRQIAKDAAFIDEGKKMSEDFATQSPEDVDALIRIVGNTPPEATDYIAKLMRKQGIEIQ